MTPRPGRAGAKKKKKPGKLQLNNYHPLRVCALINTADKSGMVRFPCSNDENASTVVTVAEVRSCFTGCYDWTTTGWVRLSLLSIIDGYSRRRRVDGLSGHVCVFLYRQAGCASFRVLKSPSKGGGEKSPTVRVRCLILGFANERDEACVGWLASHVAFHIYPYTYISPETGLAGNDLFLTNRLF